MALVKVELVSTHFDKFVREEIEKWWKGKISGERCAKTIVDKAGDTLPVAGIIGGMWFGAGVVGGVLGYLGGALGAAAEVGGVLGSLIGALGGAAAGGLCGQALNRRIKLLRYRFI